MEIQKGTVAETLELQLLTRQLEKVDYANRLIFAEKIKNSLLNTLLADPDFRNLIINLLAYYNSLGDDLFEYHGKTLQELVLIRTSQVLAEKGNKKMKFYLNDIRKKLLKFMKVDLISQL